uniref:Uncharacterized protein n=1 Tax=Arundo donax TaxID=35708 RepID=A0A0A8YPA3_ARUDO
MPQETCHGGERMSYEVQG